MSAPKGFPSQVKDARVLAQHATVEPAGQSQYGLSVLSHTFHYVVGTDLVEANTNADNNRYRITATAHSVIKGDVIRFTSGAFSGREVRVASVFDADNFDLVESLSAAPAAADGFQILRNKAPVINADGTLFTSSAGDTSFQYNGSSTLVREDTVTPANNRPLPVKLIDMTGSITVTANELNVRLDQANDSIKIGDGTDLLAVNADGSINVVSAESATAADGGALPAVQKVIAGYDGAAVQVIKTDAAGELQVDVLTLPAVTATDLDIRDLVFASDKVDVSGSSVALDAGTLAALESITVQNGAGAAAVNIQDGGNSITVDGSLTVSATDLDVRDLTHVSDSVKVGDGTDFLAISAAGAASVSVVDALPAGTNNIGDVDVLTMPATFAEDTAHASADTGVFVLGVRNDNGATTFTSTDGDYSPIAVTSSGAVRVAVNFVAADGGALPNNQAVIAGYDGAAVQAIKTDSAGELQIDVLSVVPGTSATSLGKAEDGPHASGDVGVMALAVRSDAGGAFAADGDYVPLSINASGELRVTTATTATLDVVDFLDTPLLDASSTNIPASASTPVTVVASLAAAVKKVQFLDTTGSFIGLYSDPAGTPVLEAVFGPGSDQTVEVSLAATTTLGLRNMENSAITVGLVSLNFIG